MARWTYRVKLAEECKCAMCRDGSDLLVGYICESCGVVGYKPVSIEQAEAEVEELAPMFESAGRVECTP